MTAGTLESLLLGRIVRPADYVRVLATPMRLCSPHFAVHHLEGRPLPLKRLLSRADAARAEGSASAMVEVSAPVTASLSTELSTGVVESPHADVDDSRIPGSASARENPGASLHGEASPPAGIQRWLGLVVPKRHAKRAVTRTLVKRQIRNVAADCAPRLAPGLWVVRQRSPFDPKQYPSAASDALKEAARDELRALFERAARGERDRLKPRAPQAAEAPGKPSKSGKKAPSASPGSPASAGAAPTQAPPPAAPEGTSCAA